uniref:Cytochrome P450 n=1 Tax=Pseudictyota dubia TaxID=2749911 RepID=A0A7R9WI71_9STRA
MIASRAAGCAAGRRWLIKGGSASWQGRLHHVCDAGDERALKTLPRLFPANGIAGSEMGGFLVHGPSRRFSTVPDDANARTKSSQCPLSGRSLSSDAAAAASATTSTFPNDDVTAKNSKGNQPELTKVPSMPVFGSFFVAVPFIGDRLSTFMGIPIMTAGNAYEFYPEMRRRFGDFYALDIPGIGSGPRGTCVVLNDPAEMIKVVRQEGSHPRGGVESLFPFQSWMRSRGMAAAGKGDDPGFMGRGDTWRRLRTFLQTDLLSPQAARGYVPGVAEAAAIASRGANSYRENLNDFFNYAAFDMFTSVFFGQLTRTADPEAPTSAEDDEFCRVAVESLNLLIAQLMDKTQLPLHKMGVETEAYRKYVEAQDAVNRIAREKISRFTERHEAGELDEFEKASYLARAIDRLKADDCAVTAEEFEDICVLLLNASVDTTSTFMCWMAVHLAVNPAAQEELYEEIRAHVDGSGGAFTAESLAKKRSPYLHAALRESHRLTPVHPTTMTKSNSAGAITVHGREFPKDSVFTFDQFSLGMDPDVVDDPQAFRPERWLPESLEAAKGTPMEVLDHPFYRDPFSQGARRCPGSRVAVNETLAFLARLVYDWRIEAPEGVETYRDVKYEQQTLLMPQLPQLKFVPRPRNT